MYTFKNVRSLSSKFNSTYKQWRVESNIVYQCYLRIDRGPQFLNCEQTNEGEWLETCLMRCDQKEWFIEAKKGFQRAKFYGVCSLKKRLLITWQKILLGMLDISSMGRRRLMFRVVRSLGFARCMRRLSFDKAPPLTDRSSSFNFAAAATFWI